MNISIETKSNIIVNLTFLDKLSEFLNQGFLWKSF